RRVHRAAVRFHALRVLAHVTRDAVRARILAGVEIVMEEGARGDDEHVEDHHRHAGGAGPSPDGWAVHQTDYGTIAAMIPLRDVIPSRTFPFINISLIVLNAVAFVYELSVSDAGMQPFLQVFALVPGHFLW